jgi:hypothetical protein
MDKALDAAHLAAPKHVHDGRGCRGQLAKKGEANPIGE